MAQSAQTEVSAAAIPRVNIGWLHPFFEILDEMGVSWAELLERAQLPVLASDDGSTLVSTSRVYDFVALATQQAPLADLGLRAGSRLDITTLLLDPEDTWSRPGVFRTLEGFIRVALESSSNVEMWIEMRSDPTRTSEFFYRGTFDRRHPAFSTVEQFMVALMVRWVRFGAGRGWTPTQVNVRASAMPEAKLRRLVGDAQILCGQEVTSIVFPSVQFDGTVEAFPAKDSPIWKRHRRQLERTEAPEDLPGSLRIVLRAYLPDGSPGIEHAARLAGTSVRTLQRRLGEQGVTYSDLLDDLRHDLAIYLLRDQRRTVSEVSQELGYRDPAIFTRAFRRWTGRTPSSFRNDFGD